MSNNYKSTLFDYAYFIVTTLLCFKVQPLSIDIIYHIIYYIIGFKVQPVSVDIICHNISYIIGDNCGRDQNYVCTESSDCVSLKDSIKSNNYLDICSFDGSKPIVCCPPAIDKTLPSTKFQTGQIAAESTNGVRCRISIIVSKKKKNCEII